MFMELLMDQRICFRPQAHLSNTRILKNFRPTLLRNEQAKVNGCKNGNKIQNKNVSIMIEFLLTVDDIEPKDIGI